MSQVFNNPGGRWMFALPAGIALVLVLIGTMLVGIDRYEVAVAARMRTWPSTPGTVTGAGMRDQRLQDGRLAHYADTGYRYQVDGRTYTFTVSEYAGLGSGYGHPLEYVGNAPVPIYYDPDDPSHGSVTNGQSPPTFALIVIAILLYAATLPFWYLSVRWFLSRPRARPAATA
jgi:hypothetical protein